MSNFTGVTFANQHLSPEDDAAVRRAILTDGMLTGCELSVSGPALTMEPGYLLICGRQIRHTASQSWDISQQSSGYARLLLTIDLSLTATEEVFDQVEVAVEYAETEDGFPGLEQEDINNSGTVYQVAIAVLSLGPEGISDIVRQLEPCEYV